MKKVAEANSKEKHRCPLPSKSIPTVPVSTFLNFHPPFIPAPLLLFFKDAKNEPIFSKKCLF
jgi:hypothetical protein